MQNINNEITYSTCFYILKNKHNLDNFKGWIHNMLSQVNYYNLVIYTNEESKYLFNKYLSNKNILVVIKPIEELNLYKYKEQWIYNHERNNILKNRITWELNMLWNEKIYFVYETKQKYFNTTFYGWCDIGYFRNGPNDMKTNELVEWSHPNIIKKLDSNKIYYALINNNNSYIKELTNIVNNKNNFNLPVNPIPVSQQSIGGGFFICHKNKIEMWKEYYYEKLDLYLKHNYLITDDQTIICDCVFSRLEDFKLISENNVKYDKWFVFQRYLTSLT